jgi:hypothetical protein
MSILDIMVPSEEYFDAAQGLYWYCSDYHSGQWSEEYSILSTLGYKPASSECGPDPDSTAADIYAALESEEVSVSDVRQFVDRGYSAAHAEES